ncbi:glycosyltransferase family 1 protein [bacterium CPR1]|nr:glycosyltransferase family 1 protein [bacterium CPR1]
MSRYTMTLALPDKTGAARMAFFFCRALQDTGHAVQLIHGPVPSSSSILDDMHSVGVVSELESGLSFPIGGVSKRIAAHARRFQSEAVIGVCQRDHCVALEAAREIARPGVLLMQNLVKFWGRWPIAAIKRLYYTRTLRRWMALGVCSSEAVRLQLVRELAIKPDRLCMVTNGIDTDDFSRASPELRERVREELQMESGELLLLNVGRMDAQKGLDILIESMAELRGNARWKLFCVGGYTEGAGRKRSESYRSQLEARIRQLGLEKKIQFLGWRNDTAQLLGAADLYIHSSRFEGWPLAVMEAMACSLPIVATDCVGRPEGFIDGRHGYIVPSENPTALARAVEQSMAISDEERSRWGAQARALVREHYDVRLAGRRFVQNLTEKLRSAVGHIR